MSDSATENLARLCAETEKAAQDGLAWFRKNPDRVAQQRPVLEKEFRLAAVEARKLQAAAKRPMAVGVYGLSQAGKSYLISTLARPPGKPLTAVLDQPRPFLAEINPEKEGEATGLVTRFTMRRETGPAALPVKLRLLSETDLVKVLANSWYCDAQDPIAAGAVKPEEIRAALEEAEAKAGPDSEEIVAEDVWDLQSYVEAEFRNIPTAEAFGVVFWDALAALLPRLPLDRRIELYELLWNRFPPFTQLLTRLLSRLRDLRFEQDAWAPISALVPKTDSVLDVDTLEKLADPAAPTIAIESASGRRCTLSRPELTALTAELQITMAELPWPIFESTDLLDFPGARARMAKNHAAEIGADPGNIGLYFLRGKVAYLFERYAAERELNSLLLCIKESNNEFSATVRQSIRHWIARTHGERPEDRQGVATSLFIVLTRMDMHFLPTPGRDPNGPSADLWEKRVQMSLLQPLQEAGGWLDAWHPNRAFDNTLLARNPERSAGLTKLEAGQEVAYHDGIEDRVKRWGADFAGQPMVRRYVADPERAWAEVFRRNDAGMSYLVERLTPVCRPIIKLGQVENQIRVRRAAMGRRLAEYHVSDDLAVERDRRLAALEPARIALFGAIESGRFGALLTRLHMAPEDARELLLRGAAETPAAAAPEQSAEERLRAMRRRGPATPTGTPAAPPPAGGREDGWGRALVSGWIAKLRRFAEDPVERDFFGLTGAAADALVAEVAAVARRTKLPERIAARLRRLHGSLRFVQAAEGRAIAAAFLVNETVNYLGHSEAGLLAEDRPVSADTGLKVFEPPPPVGPGFEVSEQQTAFGHDFGIDWVDALADAVDRNVRDRAGAGTVDLAANAELGTILRKLA